MVLCFLTLCSSLCLEGFVLCDHLFDNGGIYAFLGEDTFNLHGVACHFQRECLADIRVGLASEHDGVGSAGNKCFHGAVGAEVGAYALDGYCIAYKRLCVGEYFVHAHGGYFFGLGLGAGFAAAGAEHCHAGNCENCK